MFEELQIFGNGFEVFEEVFPEEFFWHNPLVRLNIAEEVHCWDSELTSPKRGTYDMEVVLNALKAVDTKLKVRNVEA